MFFLLVVLIIPTFLFAQNCDVKSYRLLDMMYPSTEINLLDDYSLDLSKMPDVSNEMKNYSTSEADYWAYLSPSDSSIMVFVLEDGMKFFGICSSKEDCDNKSKDFFIRDVIIDEFNRLQSVGVFAGTAREADSLIHHIVDKIENAPYAPTAYDAKSYNLRRQNEDVAEMIVPKSSFCSNLGGKYDGQLCGLIDTVRQCILVSDKVQPQQILTPRKIKMGKQYRIFDLNGNFIGTETWQGAFPKCSFPVVIRFIDR